MQLICLFLPSNKKSSQIQNIGLTSRMALNEIENWSFFFPYTSFLLSFLFFVIYICILPIEDLRMLKDDAIIKMFEICKVSSLYLPIHALTQRQG